ncbi:MAG: hypothetical protein GQ582_03630 [Methyloprofundus sp.]|nr:hypothetical protein [Methyloprofundus sp.]
MSIMNSAHAEQAADSGKIQGKINEIIEVAGYTYVEVDTGSEKVWAAGPTTALKKGERVAFSNAMPMQNFYSESLQRNFSLIYFIRRFITDTAASTSLSKPSAHAKTSQTKQSFAGIEPLEGGKNIAEILAEKDKLKGEKVRVRGKVTRFAAEIMGKNWLHIQDSSGLEDLTVTTHNTVAVGDLVIIEGTLELDKDYNYGYLYPVIVLDAKVIKE